MTESEEVKTCGGDWELYLKVNCIGDIARIQNNYPYDKTVVIDISKVHSTTTYTTIIDHPGVVIEAIQSELLKTFGAQDGGNPFSGNRLTYDAEINIRFVNITSKKLIVDITNKDVGHLISINGVVKNAGRRYSDIVTAQFMCEEGHFQNVEGEYGEVEKPHKCTALGCKSRYFKHKDMRDKTANAENTYIQDPLELLPPGVQPQDIRCYSTESLCGVVKSGERVTINGILRAMPKEKLGVLQSGKVYFIEVNSIEKPASDYDDIVLTAKDEMEIVELSKKDNVFDLLARSIAPQITGTLTVKGSVLLQLFEGVSRIDPNGVRTRGQINVLIASDPGMGKTKILEYAQMIAPRGVMASGPSSSKVGLVATIGKDEVSGTWSICAGSYMLANKGLLCLDEGDKTGPEGLDMIGQAMESGRVNIDKGDVHHSVQTEASLLMAVNAKGGKKFDMSHADGMASQINIPDYILSRFDLKVMLTNDPNIKKDGSLTSAVAAARRKTNSAVEPHIKPDFIRKYIAYSRKYNPEMPEKFDQMIDDYIVTLEKDVRQLNGFEITPRQTSSIILLSEAHARMKLRNEVTEEDVNAAIRLFDISFRIINTDPFGNIDPGRSLASKPKQSLAYNIIRTVKEIGGETKKASELSVISALKAAGYEEQKIENTIRLLLREGKLSEPINGLLKLV